jgi:hypothetical protein
LHFVTKYAYQFFDVLESLQHNFVFKDWTFLAVSYAQSPVKGIRLLWLNC